MDMAHHKTMRFPVVIHKDKDSDYGVTVPDLPGCFSAGDTVDDALTNAIEAIECHIEGILIDGETVPSARTIEFHSKNRQFSGGIWALADVDLSKLSGKAKRVNITLPEHLLVQIDSYASRSGETRSGFLVHAAMEYVSTHADSGSEQDADDQAAAAAAAAVKSKS
jgi:predicted RNase H-like HicB family nuclease